MDDDDGDDDGDDDDGDDNDGGLEKGYDNEDDNMLMLIVVLS